MTAASECPRFLVGEITSRNRCFNTLVSGNPAVASFFRSHIVTDAPSFSFPVFTVIRNTPPGLSELGFKAT